VEFQHVVEGKRTTDVTMHDKDMLSRGKSINEALLLRIVKQKEVFVVENSAYGVEWDLLLDIVDLKIEKGPHVVQERDKFLLVVVAHQVNILDLRKVR